MQVWPLPQVPQEPPQPSAPHVLPLQAAWQTHWLFAPHTVEPPHLPHVPPQPSGPQVLPVQLGAQTLHVNPSPPYPVLQTHCGAPFCSVHTALTSQPPVWAHTPLTHASPVVQGSPSSQGPWLATCTQPMAGLHESTVHGRPSSHWIAAKPVHLPLVQVPGVLHLLPSVQAPPSATGVCVQAPTVAQVSVVHRSPSSQGLGLSGLHLPSAHCSPVVQTLPSSHAEPSAMAVNVQPLVGSQVSVVHVSPSSQAPALLPAWQVPPLHVSPVVQTLPALQVAVLGVNLQPVPAVQESSVQGLLSLHDCSAPATHFPAEHMSLTVHGSPSSQATVSGEKTHPLDGLQLSAVQTLPSLQVLLVPAQAPLLHVSETVQASRSSQALAVLVCTHELSAAQLSVVQLLPSSQFTAVCTQPLALSQASMVQGSLSLQSLVPPLAHLPLEHESLRLHWSPKVHGALLLVWVQPVASQSSVVQIWLSSQLSVQAQIWLLPQTFPGPHVPQTPPQPSSPQFLPPAHCGTQHASGGAPTGAAPLPEQLAPPEASAPAVADQLHVAQLLDVTEPFEAQYWYVLPRQQPSAGIPMQLKD